MTTFTKAKRENVGLWINLIGGTGSGKTKTSMRLATGICGLQTAFAVIDTENGRAKHYAPLPGEEADGIDTYNFDHCGLSAPFRPDAYSDAVMDADKAGYPVIVVDSGSHVWAGDGGMLDWQEDELTRMAGDDWQKRERVKMSAWIKPKMSHKHMVSKLLQVKAHIILCLRAEQKIEMVKVGGKMEIRAKQSLTGLDGWIPVCDKNLPFEATASFLLTADAPGIPKPIKLQDQHRALFPLDQPITEQSGVQLAKWASGSKDGAVSQLAESTLVKREGAGSSPAGTATITPDEALALEARCTDNGVNVAALKKAANVERLSMIAPDDLPRAHQWVDRAIEKRKGQS